MRRFLLLNALLGLLMFLLLAGCDRKENPGSTQGPLAADFTLHDLSGQEVTLSSYRGKIVLLNFWATWCPPCREELPSMERLNEAFGARDFVMLTVNVDDDIESLRQFLSRNPHRFTVVYDEGRTAQRLYNVDKFPETFIIDRDGRVIDHIVGARDWSSPGALKYFNALVGTK